jgi:hypothetical protein
MHAGRYFLMLAILCIAGACSTTAPITKIESRIWPPKVVTERVLDQFGDVLIPPEPWPKGSDKPKLPLSDLWYTTRSRGTYVAGLCEIDSVVFEFEPAAEPDRGADTPVKVVGIATHRSFHFLATPVLAEHPSSLEWADNQALSARCAAAPIDTNYFGARDAEMARDGVRLLLAVKNQVVNGFSQQFFECDGDVVSACRDTILTLNADNIDRIERCEDSDRNRGAFCVDIRGLDSIVRIYATGFGEYAKPFNTRISEVVTISDPRAD